MSLIFKNDAFCKACHYVALFQEFVDTPVKGHPSLFRIDTVRHMETSLSRFVGLLILSVWFYNECETPYLTNFLQSALDSYNLGPLLKFVFNFDVFACLANAHCLYSNKRIDLEI
jgi:hypothetical protein